MILLESSHTHLTVWFPLSSLLSPTGSTLVVTGWLPATLVASFPLSFQRRKRKSTSMIVRTKVPELSFVSPDWSDLGHCYSLRPTTRVREMWYTNWLRVGSQNSTQELGRDNPTQTTWLKMWQECSPRVFRGTPSGRKRESMQGGHLQMSSLVEGWTWKS